MFFSAAINKLLLLIACQNLTKKTDICHVILKNGILSLQCEKTGIHTHSCYFSKANFTGYRIHGQL
jgi:hypothetical protein